MEHVVKELFQKIIVLVSLKVAKVEDSNSAQELRYQLDNHRLPKHSKNVDKRSFVKNRKDSSKKRSNVESVR